MDKDVVNNGVVNMHDVTVRIPFHTTPEDMAMLVWAGVLNQMRSRDIIGEPAVLFRKDGTGPIIMFHEGVVDPYDGVLPHGLIENKDKEDNEDIQADN